MSKKSYFSLLIVCIYGALLNSCVVTNEQQPIVAITSLPEEKSNIDVCFSPEGNCQPIILNLINNARKKIYVQSYSFTSQNIANALIKAHQRGIKVKILFDRSQLTARHSQIHTMKKAGIECHVDPVLGIAHNKIMIIDNNIVLTGSYNWTNAAETRNAENLLIIKNHPTANIYKSNWKRRYQRAKEMRLQDLTNKSFTSQTRVIRPKVIH